jgi:putative cofactor-binding repeat protein
VNVFRAGGVLGRQPRCRLRLFRDPLQFRLQLPDDREFHARLRELALYAEFAFEGAVIANNLADKAAIGISVANFKQGGRLAVVQGNLVHNLFFRKDVDSRGIGIAVEADSVERQCDRRRTCLRHPHRLGQLSARCERHG